MGMMNVNVTSKLAQTVIADSLSNIFHSRFTPPPKLNLVEWADTYRYLPDNSAEKGKWRTSRVEVSRQPMLSVSDNTVSEVTIMSCIQLMKTELMINAALYYMHQEPTPIMYVAPKKEVAEAWSKERLTLSINSTPVLKDIFADNRRGDGNTILQKQFPGGQISIVSARNPDDLAMRACRLMLFDECDKYPVNTGAGKEGSGGEGDPIAVAWGRATTFGERKKKITACSPTVRGSSRIEQEYLSSNQSVFYQPCPHCGHAKELMWEDISIPVNKQTGEYMADDAYILCSECRVPWNEGDRMRSISTGYWYAKKPEITYHHGYKVSSLASPFTKIKMLAREFVKAFGNPQLMKVFMNTRMAITWQEDGDQPDWEVLYDRREAYRTCKIPSKASMLTMGVDVQKDGIWYETVAWGRNRESWSIDMAFLEGSILETEFRNKLKVHFDTIYDHQDGVAMMSEIVNVDSGYETNAVYSLVRECGTDRIRAVKGEKEANMTQILAAPVYVDVNWEGARSSRGLKLWKVGSSMLKTEFYAWLKLKKPSPEKLKEGATYPLGYCHFPEWDEGYFKQITAEIKIHATDNKGYDKEVWHRLRKDNHLLDCRVYARAGASMLLIDRMNDEDWDKREKLLRINQVDTQVESSDNKISNITSKPASSRFKYAKR